MNSRRGTCRPCCALTHRPAEAAGSVPWVSGRSANIDVQAMAPTSSNSVDRTGDQTRCPTSDCGGLDLPLTGVGAWRRTPCDVSTSDGVSRLSAVCGRAVGPSCARAAIGPAASVTNRAKDKGFMRVGEWKRLHTQDCLPRPGGPQTGRSAALSLGTVLAAYGPSGDKHVECHADNWRPLAKLRASAIEATRALAVSGPMPGIFSSRRLSSLL